MPAHSQTTLPELKSWLDKGQTLVLLDVNTPDTFQAAHLPGAVNACVYQVDFLMRTGKLVADKKTQVVVYGTSGNSLASEMAAEKLAAAGYEDVVDFRGGLAVWRAAGLGLDGQPAVGHPPPRTLQGPVPLDLAQSRIEWVGRNLANKHWGTVGLKSGVITFAEGQPTQGRALIDMSSITDLNIEDASLRQVLEAHLRSDDFFDVARFPEATFEMSRIAPIPGAAPGALNYEVRGPLTLKGITSPIEFRAAGGFGGKGEWIAQANFDLDRTAWKVLYGSGRYFESLGMHLVNDLVSLQVRIVTTAP